MELFKKTTTFDFMSKRTLALAFSALLIIVSIGSLATRGLNFGIDFTGGTLIEVAYESPAELSEIRSALSSAGYGDAIVQHFGTSQDVLIRLQPRKDVSSADLSNKIINSLKQATTEKIDLRRVEFVGPQVGDELTEDGGLAMLYALFGIFIYVMFRFEWKFSLGSVAALMHDVIIVLGIFSVFMFEFDLTVLAAILAVIGYSLNDTIVVFDRIRENFRKMRKGTSVDIINGSLNQTLSRTLMTSITTMLVLLALFIFGGEIIHQFALALILGIFIGTYSSIYIASPVVLALGVSKQDLMPVKKEGVEEDDRP
ncbi:MAG: protein translocase subunit SecF [Gammaproteobacteria bacterium]|nr:protein translocase subunit SecF [Gammaproteobacteria bacterium]MDH5593199.1 protein translocase subunit SecF [Gammaproteobacteria bacterium]